MREGSGEEAGGCARRLEKAGCGAKANRASAVRAIALRQAWLQNRTARSFGNLAPREGWRYCAAALRAPLEKRKVGYPVRCGLSAPAQVSGILGHPHARVTTAREKTARWCLWRDTNATAAAPGAMLGDGLPSGRGMTLP